MRSLCRMLPVTFLSMFSAPHFAKASETETNQESALQPPGAHNSAANSSAQTGHKSEQPHGPAPLAEAITPPKLLHYEPPTLPASHVVPADTYVDLLLTINTHGEVTDAQTEAPSDSVLVLAASAAARSFRFAPAMQGDEAVAVIIQYRFWFPSTALTPAHTGPATGDSTGALPDSNPLMNAAAPAQVTDHESVTEHSSGDRDEEQDAHAYEAVAAVNAPVFEATRRSITQAQLTTVPGTRGDAIRAIELLPGVGRAPEGSLPILRGASPGESVTFLDGTAIPFLYHFGGVTSVVHPKLIEQVDVMPANFSPRYGRVTGGVIEAKLRRPRIDRMGAVVDANLVDSSILVEGPLGENTSLALSGRRSNIDFVFDNFVPRDTFDVVAAPVYWDYQAILQHQWADQHFLRVAAFGGQDQLKLVFAQPSKEDPRLRGDISGRIAFHRVQVLHQTSFGQLKQRAHLSLGLQSLEQHLGPAEAYFNIQEGDARLEWEVPLHHAASFVAGVDASAQWLTGAYRGSVPQAQEGAQPVGAVDQAVIDRSTISLINPALYLEARLYPVDRWLVMPGVRADYNHQTGSLTVNPRLNQRLDITADTTLKAGAGLYSQPPQYFELLLPWGNPELKPYHALHTTIGAEHRLTPAFDLEAEAFFKYLYQRVVGTEGGTAPGFVNDGQGRIYGFELGSTYAPDDRLFARLAYTLSRSERRDRDDGWRLFDYDQTHVLSVASGYRFDAGWHIGGRYRYVTGNPHTPVSSATFDATAGVYVPSFERINTGRDPAFSQLDLRVEKQFEVGTASIAVYLDLQNVLFTDNQQGFTYSYDYTQREGSSVGPFLPNLGVRGEL